MWLDPQAYKEEEAEETNDKYESTNDCDNGNDNADDSIAAVLYHTYKGVVVLQVRGEEGGGGGGEGEGSRGRERERERD